MKTSFKDLEVFYKAVRRPALSYYAVVDVFLKDGYLYSSPTSKAAYYRIVNPTQTSLTNPIHGKVVSISGICYIVSIVPEPSDQIFGKVYLEQL